MPPFDSSQAPSSSQSPARSTARIREVDVNDDIPADAKVLHKRIAIRKKRAGPFPSRGQDVTAREFVPRLLRALAGRPKRTLVGRSQSR